MTSKTRQSLKGYGRYQKCDQESPKLTVSDKKTRHPTGSASPGDEKNGPGKKTPVSNEGYSGKVSLFER